MNLKKLCPALLAVLALGAVIANSAFATAEETSGSWFKEGTVLASGTKEPVTCGNSGNFILESTVGTNNTPLKLEATGVTCPEGKIFNESEKAKATGHIKFTGVTVVKPTGCKVTGGTVETEALKSQVWMEGTKVMQKFEPASGTTFAVVPISGCSIEEEYPATGTVFGESTNETGFGAETQELKFTGTINSTAGGALKFGGHAATLAGTGTFKLTGGGPWGAIVHGGVFCWPIGGTKGNYKSFSECIGTLNSSPGSGSWERSTP